MNERHVLSIQLDEDLRGQFKRFLQEASTKLGRKVTDAEAARVLLRRGIDSRVSLTDAGYLEGWRAGMAAAKKAFLQGVEEGTKKCA